MQKLPPHITGNSMLQCPCGGSMYHLHPKLGKWLKAHAKCVSIIASGQRKFCKDCVHFKAEVVAYRPLDPSYLCTRNSGNLDCITGRAVTLYCEGERDEGQCGPAAKFFEQKPQTSAKPA